MAGQHARPNRKHCGLLARMENSRAAAHSRCSPLPSALELVRKETPILLKELKLAGLRRQAQLSCNPSLPP